MALLARTLWYMGTKARLLPGFLDQAIEEEVPPDGTVVDLMSGTGVVSAFCADRWRVFANDSEDYAYFVARSLIEHDPEEKDRFIESIDDRRDLARAFDENRTALERIYAAPLAVEDSLLRRFAEGETDEGWCREYRAFLEAPGSVYGSPVRRGRGSSLYGASRDLTGEDSISAYRADSGRKPACLITAYYANIYFGIRQSIAIDSLRAAINALRGRGPLVERKRVHYLSALLHAASVSTSGTSHFAQPRHLTKDTELRAMAERRLVDVRIRAEEFSRDLLDAVRGTHYRAGNRCFLGDYRSLLRNASNGVPLGPGFLFPGKVDLVYFDPPYTGDNYSRFYHVLNVLARYDYPPLERDAAGRVVRGRYPSIARRFQSGFCRRTEVEGEFRQVIAASAGTGAKLVVSYASPTGLLLKELARRSPRREPVKQLEDICRESYGDVETRRRNLMHSGQGDSNIAVEELLVICRGPR